MLNVPKQTQTASALNKLCETETRKNTFDTEMGTLEAKVDVIDDKLSTILSSYKILMPKRVRM